MIPGRDEYSAWRSVRRAVGLVLAAPWDVQLARREPQKRPLAVVQPIGPTTTGGTAYVRDYEQLFEVNLYPSGVEGDALTSKVEAIRLKSTMLRAFDTGHETAGTRAMRIPLFDYSEVAATAVLPGDAEHIDYLRVTSLNGDVQVDPEDDSLFTVLIDLRIAWRDEGDISRFQGLVMRYMDVVMPLG